jgi:1-acyl-sn-glycerol-3-phosphate acyltransferase
MIAGALATVARTVAGTSVRWTVVPEPEHQYIFISNHCSHLDFIIIWSYLPAPLRRRSRPVAAADYWSSRLRQRLATHYFNAVLVERHREGVEPSAPLGVAAVERMSEALAEGSSLILFPEGTRGDGSEVGAFRAGLYHLCCAHPGVDVLPVYLENLNRILPKGALLPVPMLSRIVFGSPLRLSPGEGKTEFLQRARQAVVELRPA